MSTFGAEAFRNDKKRINTVSSLYFNQNSIFIKVKFFLQKHLHCDIMPPETVSKHYLRMCRISSVSSVSTCGNSLPAVGGCEYIGRENVHNSVVTIT